MFAKTHHHASTDRRFQKDKAGVRNLGYSQYWRIAVRLGKRRWMGNYKRAARVICRCLPF